MEDKTCRGLLDIAKDFVIKNYKRFYALMGNGKKKNKKLNLKPYYWVAIVMIFIVLIFYVGNFYNFSISDDPERWGNFGDYTGGTLNPILAFLSFLALLQTIKIQAKELKNSRKELRKSSKALEEQSKSLKIQNFETTFFNMISLHNEIVNNIKINNNLAFSYTNSMEHNNFNKIFFVKNPNITKTESIYGIDAINYILTELDSFSSKYNNEARLFNNLYILFYNAMQIHLCNYFGNIYQILKLISSNKNLTKKQKKKYSNIFRTQFLSAELRLLFYHYACKMGESEFKKYIEKFKFFEYLTLEDNYNLKFILCRRLYKNSVFNNREDIDKFIIEVKEDMKNTRELEEKICIIKQPYSHISISYILDSDLDTLKTFEEFEEKDTTIKPHIEACIKELEDEIKRSKTSSQEPQ